MLWDLILLEIPFFFFLNWIFCYCSSKRKGSSHLLLPNSGGRSPGSPLGLYYQANESVVLLLQSRSRTFQSPCGLHWQCRERSLITVGQWWMSWLFASSWKASPTTQRGREALLPMEVGFQTPHIVHWFQGWNSQLRTCLFWPYPSLWSVGHLCHCVERVEI